jgi:hypothetical protein
VLITLVLPPAITDAIRTERRNTIELSLPSGDIDQVRRSLQAMQQSWLNEYDVHDAEKSGLSIRAGKRRRSHKGDSSAMSNQLTMEEMEAIYDVFHGDPPDDDQIDDALYDSIVEKMVAGMHSLQRQQEHAKVAVTETFPEQISQEEAELYNKKGSEMMLEAAKMKLDEKTHADLSCLWIGLTSGLCQVTGMPRAIFCTTMASNVGFTALKAAWHRGRTTG